MCFTSLGDWMEHWRYLLCAWSLSFKPVPLVSYIQWFGHSHQTTFSTPWTNSNPYTCLTYCLSRLVCTGFWSLHWWSNHLVGLGTQHRDLSNHFEAQSWGGWTHTEDVAQARGREGWATLWRLEGSHCPGISTWWLTAGFCGWNKQKWAHMGIPFWLSTFWMSCGTHWCFCPWRSLLHGCCCHNWRVSSSWCCWGLIW